MYNEPDSPLARHQSVMLELLHVLDEVCRKLGIPYQLFAGSALGAVRHQGFIPWDDDVDVVMLRPDYERFLALAPGELDAGRYFLQAEFSEHYPMYFSKLRKNGTTCLERFIPRDAQMHQGVYIDIFPCDNLADSFWLRGTQYLASKVVVAKSLYRRGYLTDSRVKKLFMAVCRFVPQKPLLALVRLPGENKSACVHTFLGGSSRYEKGVFPRAWFLESVMLPFADGCFPVSAHYDALLTTLYGDYRTPLPEPARGCKVHAELVDLDCSYERYLDTQRQMKFNQLSRSIR